MIKVIRVHVLSKRLLLNPLGNLNKERLALEHARNLNMSHVPTFITLHSNPCFFCQGMCGLHFSFPQGHTEQTGNTQPAVAVRKQEFPDSSRKTNPDRRDSSSLLIYQSEGGILRYHSQRAETDMVALCTIYVV